GEPPSPRFLTSVRQGSSSLAGSDTPCVAAGLLFFRDLCGRADGPSLVLLLGERPCAIAMIPKTGRAGPNTRRRVRLWETEPARQRRRSAPARVSRTLLPGSFAKN